MKEKILSILSDHSKINNVTPESNLITDFGLSSFEIAELICAIEDELDIEIPEKDLIKIKTIGDICDYADAM